LQDCSGEDVSGVASELINVIDQSARPALRNRENRRQEQEAGDGNVSTETSHRIPLYAEVNAGGEQSDASQNRTCGMCGASQRSVTDEPSRSGKSKPGGVSAVIF